MLTLSKSALSYVYYNIFYIRRNFELKGGKYAILNIDEQLKDDDLCRYFYMICVYLKSSGFNVVVKSHWRDFKNFKIPFDFKKLLLKQNYILVKNCSTPLNSIVLVRPNKPNHIIHLSYGYNIIRSGDFDCIANYLMYPTQYKHYSSLKSSHVLQTSKRAIKVFFAGDTKEIKYGSDQIRKFFDVIPRVQVINFILSNVEKSRKLANASGEAVLKQLLDSQDYTNEVIISQVKSAEEDWLRILLKTDFFICPPGVRIPWSHNCVEAMSVGAIPILQYADLFYPELENMKNCLSYSNLAELQMVIEKALAMEPSEIEKMRRNVLAYYTDHLSFDSVTNKIKTFSDSAQQEVKLAIPFIPTKQEWRAQISLYNPRFLNEIGLSRFHSSKAAKS